MKSLKSTKEGTALCASHGYRQALKELCDQNDLCHEKRRMLVIASNRGPVEFKRKGNATFLERGQGGLVTALSSLVEVIDTNWVAAPLSPEDAEIANRCEGEISLPSGEGRLNISFIRP
ncbi:MAG TPA: hypothetical protein V6C82_02650, partial [Chroococcales cyanobacterium]